MVWCRKAVWILAVWFGVWQVSLTCNTRREECNQLREVAMDMPNATARCNGMTKFRECVQEDFADCTDNSFSDQFALSMESSYCSKTYICSTNLKDCYQKYTPAIQKAIHDGNADTRVEICRSTIAEILQCQERVTSECQSQAGLMNTVEAHQASLNALCNNTDPCFTIVLRCQTSIVNLAPTPDASGGRTSRSTVSNCSSQKTVDYCGAYQNASSCIRSQLSECADSQDVNYTLTNIDNTIIDFCSAERRCRQNVETCLCHVNRLTMDSPVAIISSSFCSMVDAFTQCLDNVGEECNAVEEVRQEVDQLKANYQLEFDLYCTMKEGLCPPALQCLQELVQQAEFQSSGSDEVSPFNVDVLCLAASPLFTCLKTVSTTCVDEASEVTFTTIENNFLDMCLEIGPHLQKLSTCVSFDTCMKQFDLVQLGLSVSNSPVVQKDVVIQMFAGLPKTEFWCSYLVHGFHCMANTSVACGLDQQLAAEAHQNYVDLNKDCGAPTTPAPAVTTKDPGSGSQTTTLRTSKTRDGASSLVSSFLWTLLVAMTVTLCMISPTLN